VARLAGLPDEVLSRAKEILTELESAISQQRKPFPQRNAGKRSAISTGRKQRGKRAQNYAEIDVDHLTPLEALNQLYAVHAMLKSN
jgi:DNA mismatch repair protein MutS